MVGVAHGAAGQLSMTPSGEQAITGNCDPRKAPRLLNTVRRSRPNKEVRTYMLNKHGCHVSCTLTSVHLTVSVNRKVIFPHAVSVCAVIPPPVFAPPPLPPLLPPLTVSMTLCAFVIVLKRSINIIAPEENSWPPAPGRRMRVAVWKVSRSWSDGCVWWRVGLLIQ